MESLNFVDIILSIISSLITIIITIAGLGKKAGVSTGRGGSVSTFLEALLLGLPAAAAGALLAWSLISSFFIGMHNSTWVDTQGNATTLTWLVSLLGGVLGGIGCGLWAGAGHIENRNLAKFIGIGGASLVIILFLIDTFPDKFCFLPLKIQHIAHDWLPFAFIIGLVTLVVAIATTRAKK